MFEYEWGNPSLLLPPSGDTDDGNHHRHPSDGVYSTGHVDAGDIQSFISPTFLPFQHPNNHYHHHHHQNSLQTIMDPRAFPSASFSPTGSSMLSSTEFDSFLTLPKPEPGPVSNSTELDRIGLNLGLGGRTYFSAADEDFLTRLYRRSRPFDGGSLVVNSPKCQAEGCNADLSNAKHYHRRHKVCEFHSKAATVVAGGLTQRFCQQCSRFHLLTEFDNGKRSCRRRLADHNRRRRKSHQTTAGSQDRRSENPPRSPSESSRAHSISSVTVAVSSPMEDSIPTCYNSAPSPSISPTSIFY